MKRYLHCLLLGTITLALWSCGKDDPVDNPPSGNDAPTTISLSTSTIEAERTGGNYSLTVTAPQRPSVSVSGDWITVGDGTYNNYKITYTITVSANGTYDAREAVLTVKSGSLSTTATVKQPGLEKPVIPDTDIAKTLVTDDATAEAQALYNLLLSYYGKKTISSIMANVNWNHEEADKVYKAVGKYPAMNCYDFIHILYSGANWINYSDLTPVTEWAEAGGIVSLMWHFNVPKSEGAGTSDVTCTPSETTFRATNALKEGTWENEWFYSQMEKVADVILALQEKGIAAIWRPFHEAAGNYYALQWKGAAWFWWGYDGPEVYKQVWNAMQDYFVERGIRNLIWVWTAQDYNGNPAAYGSDAAFYPGDDRVDIIARDIYGETAVVNYSEFVSIQSQHPGKMVTLGECGKNGSTDYALIPDVWKAGAQWSWFMPWYGANMPGTAWWKAALESEYVITREDL